MARTGISSDVYAEYLLSTFDNFTCSHLAEIMDCSHDAASDALRGHSLVPRALWDRVRRHCPLELRRRGAMILDDRVLDKNFSKKIENACRQWSGNAGKVITGVGVVNWLHYDPLTDDYLPIDYRIWDRERDGTKRTEFHMTNQLHLQSRTTAEAVLGYGWKIEQFYRELKQLTGIERCQARKQRSQRNHIHCAIAAWLLLWERARSLGITVYEAKRRPFTDYLRERFGMPTAYRRPHPV